MFHGAFMHPTQLEHLLIKAPKYFRSKNAERKNWNIVQQGAEAPCQKFLQTQ
jgi:hypothetical protein